MWVAVGWGVGGGRKIKREDREVNTFKERNVNHTAVWNYVWTWMLPNRGIPRRQLWVASHTGDTHTAGEPVKHAKRPYSVFD